MKLLACNSNLVLSKEIAATSDEFLTDHVMNVINDPSFMNSDKIKLHAKIGLNCLNKKPIKTIITDDIADKTCALSNAGEIESIEKKFPN